MELAIRQAKSGKEYVFLLNYSEAEQTIQVKDKRVNILTDEVLDGDVVLEPFGVAILTSVGGSSGDGSRASF
ncbi:Beta-galactosidase C-terminal domain [Evansella sp. AB-rgal1]|uniref:Beta-galactosidase C-terminal domain n=1 Tax=Evansella sp. AB-rgal1 TaxID=3242696 RepID=UPI00359E4405